MVLKDNEQANIYALKKMRVCLLVTVTVLVMLSCPSPPRNVIPPRVPVKK